MLRSDDSDKCGNMSDGPSCRPMARNVGASGGNCEPREMITPDSDHGKKMKTRAMENSVQVESRIPLRLDPKKQTIALLRLIN